MKQFQLMLNEERLPYLQEIGEKICEDIIVTEPYHLYEIAQHMQMSDLAEEQIVLVTLTSSGKPTGCSVISKGTRNASMINQQGIFTRLLLLGASQFAVMHNHPSGETRISEDDIKCCELLKQISKIIGIDFVDFVVIGKNKYLSYREQGFFQ